MLWCKKCTPQEAIDAMAAAIAQTKETDAWKEYLKPGTHDQCEIPTAEEVPAFMLSEYKDIQDYMLDQDLLT